MLSFALIKERVGGKYALSLRMFLLGSPFWTLGFVLNEQASFTSVGGFFTVLAIALLGQAVMGLTILAGRLPLLRRNSERPIALSYLLVVWSSSALTRIVVIVQGFAFVGIPDEIPLASRIAVSGFIAIVGYGLGSYGFDAYDRFRAQRAQLLAELLASEEQLTTHRAAVETMKKTLLDQVDSQLRESRESSTQTLDNLEQALTTRSDSKPALSELHTLSDETWHSVRKILGPNAPATLPKVGIRELLRIFAESGPFRPPLLATVAVFLYLLVYSRAFDWLTGAFLVMGWLGAIVILTLGFNALLKITGPATVPLLILLSTGVVLSAVPLLEVAALAGVTVGNPFSVVSVHALALTVTLSTSLPPTVARARRGVLENLQRHTDGATLEKLHVESQLAIVTEKIASHLHGDVRGNFLASVLNLQRHIDSGDTDEARATIAKLRAALASPMDLSPPDADDERQLEIFVKNWSAILDIEFERPVSTVPAEFMPAFHTVVVDAVNNAVRHGSADWVRIGFTVERDALALTIRNNGNPRATARVGLGTIHLNQLAPEKWSRFTNEQGITQLVVRLERQNLGATVTSR